VSNSSGKKPLVIPIPDKEGYIDLPIEEADKISIRQNFIERRNELIDRCSIILPTPEYDPEDKRKIVLFGQEFYPIGYYKDSFSVNSRYKKALIKNDMNGTKYISHEINPSKIWSILYIDTTLELTKNYCIVLDSLFKNNSTPVDLELVFNQNDVEKSTNRTRIRSIENFISSEKILISDLINFDKSKNTVLKSIKFILHHQSKESEFCITKLNIERID
jgi:hypothetical protein